MQRKDEILAKKAKLAELRRQREEREQRQREGKRESFLGEPLEARASPARTTDRKELDSFIDTLVGDRPGSGAASPAGRKSRPSSYILGAGGVGTETYERTSSGSRPPAQTASTGTQTLSDAPLETSHEQLVAPAPTITKPNVETYSKGVQTIDAWSSQRRRRSSPGVSDSDRDQSSPTKRGSRREREREEELRQNLRQEIEEELKSVKGLSLDGTISSGTSKYPARNLTEEEANAVTASEEFLDFVERSSKVIEKALDQDYDVLADYALDGADGIDEDEDEGYGSSTGTKGRRIKQIAQFYDERWSKKRMISDMHFSPKNANNIMSCSSDGVVCGWTVDMLSLPQEYLELTTPPPSKTEDLSPICMAFPGSDPTSFLVGTEEGTIYPCHRYDRAGAKAGVDNRLRYKGHTAPVMSLDFHPARGPVDLGDLVLSSSLDWTIKLWKTRAATSASIAASSTSSTHNQATSNEQTVGPLLDMPQEDIVYDARWSPHKPGVFASVDGAGNVDVWDLTMDTEVPVTRTTPKGDRSMQAGYVAKSLEKVTWEEKEGKRLGVGGAAGVVTVFEVESELAGESVRNEEWSKMKRLASRLEAGR
ncbi:dynein cytoplasmic 1 intermediate chain, partial [Lecanoromycetidae sp. Uapishka_2]